jgi:hypothetical protein
MKRRLKCALGTLGAVSLVSLAACSSGSTTSQVQVTQLPQLPSASAVAKQLGFTGFTDCGPSPLGGVTDAGTAYKGSVRYGIDTFPAADIRDGWKKTAAKLGIAPLWQGTTWVAYKALKQIAAASRARVSRDTAGLEVPA